MSTNIRELQLGKGAATRPEPVVSDLFLEQLRCINSTFSDQLKVVDQKAAYVFTFMIAMMIWSEQVHNNFAQALKPALEPSWLLSSLMSGSLTLAALSAILVVLPRFVQSDASLYWGAWPEAARRLDTERGTYDKERMAADYRSSAEHLAYLCRKKYRLLRFSYQALLVGVGSYVVAITTS